jgi:hypothetical protein
VKILYYPSEYNVLVRKSERKTPLGRLSIYWEADIKIVLKGTGL